MGKRKSKKERKEFEYRYVEYHGKAKKSRRGGYHHIYNPKLKTKSKWRTYKADKKDLYQASKIIAYHETGFAHSKAKKKVSFPRFKRYWDEGRTTQKIKKRKTTQDTVQAIERRLKRQPKTWEYIQKGVEGKPVNLTLDEMTRIHTKEDAFKVYEQLFGQFIMPTSQRIRDRIIETLVLNREDFKNLIEHNLYITGDLVDPDGKKIEDEDYEGTVIGIEQELIEDMAEKIRQHLHRNTEIGSDGLKKKVNDMKIGNPQVVDDRPAEGRTARIQDMTIEIIMIT